MKNNGDRVCYMFCKLLGPQIMDFVIKQSMIFLKKHEYKQAIRAYNVIIRYQGNWNRSGRNII